MSQSLVIKRRSLYFPAVRIILLRRQEPASLRCLYLDSLLPPSFICVVPIPTTDCHVLPSSAGLGRFYRHNEARAAPRLRLPVAPRNLTDSAKRWSCPNWRWCPFELYPKRDTWRPADALHPRLRQPAAEWRKQADHFAAAGYRVTTYDMRGHDESENPNFGYRIGRFAEDLNDL